MKAIISLILSLAVVGLSAMHMLIHPVIHPTTSAASTQPKPKTKPLVHHTGTALPRASNLPTIGRPNLDSMANQGLLYGIQGSSRRGTPMVILFVSRAPNAPRHLIIQHWPSLRFAAVASGSTLSNILGAGFHSKIHWIRIDSTLLVK